MPLLKPITYLDRDGNLSIDGTFNYQGSVLELKNILEAVLEQHGQDAQCKIAKFTRFPHIIDTHIIITEK